MPNSKSRVRLWDYFGVALSMLEILHHRGHRVSQGFLCVPLCPCGECLYLRTATGSRSPASLASFAALSVASHVKSESLRPKWPYAAVFL